MLGIHYLQYFALHELYTMHYTLSSNIYSHSYARLHTDKCCAMQAPNTFAKCKQIKSKIQTSKSQHNLQHIQIRGIRSALLVRSHKIARVVGIRSLLCVGMLLYSVLHSAHIIIMLYRDVYLFVMRE